MAPPPFALARQLLAECTLAYPTTGWCHDLDSVQTVATYDTEEGQLKYTHMYFAKSVALWRELRRLPDLGEGAVVSLGAGPCLCLFGWFWDTPPASGQNVVAVDALEWSHVRSLSSHAGLVDSVLHAQLRYLARRHAPDGASPPQVAAVWNTTALAPEDIEPGSTVLVPFALNHMLGAAQPVPDPSRVFRWLQAVAGRARDVLVVDMPCDAAGPFWTQVGAGLGATGTPSVRSIDGIDEFTPLYPDHRAQFRSRRGNDALRRYTALRAHQGTWTYV